MPRSVWRVPHWPGRELIESLTPGSAVMTFGPFTGPSPRILTYAAFPSGDRTVVVRLSSPASDLVEDLRERRQLLLGHGVAVVIAGDSEYPEIADVTAPFVYARIMGTAKE